jgi:SnoaL-like domain
VDEIERIRIRLAIEDLNSAFTHCLDHDRVDELADLFTEDAVYTHGERRSVGRKAIHELFSRRLAAGSRTARHLFSGLRVSMESAERARGESVCLTFAADALPPISPAVPYLVADFTDVYVRCADSRWRIQERNITRIFTAESNPGPVGLAKDRS